MTDKNSSLPQAKRLSPVFKKPKLFIVLASVALLSSLASYLLVHWQIFSIQGMTFEMYVPSRYGGDTYFMSPDEFNLMSYIVIGIAIANLAVITWLVNRGKIFVSGLISMTVSNLLFAGYGSVIIGNVLSEQFGTGWSVIGVLVNVAVAIALFVPIILSIRSSKNGSETK